MYTFNLYAIPPFVASFSLFLVSCFVFLKNKKSIVNVAFSMLFLSAAIWEFGYSMVFLSIDEKTAIFWTKIVYIGVPLLPTTFYHFVISFLNIRKYRKFVYFCYALSIIFIIFALKTNYFINGLYKYYWGYYAKAAFLHTPFLLLFMGFWLWDVVIIFREYQRAKEERLFLEINRLKYLLLAFVFVTFASLDYLPCYGIAFYPIGFIFVIILVTVLTYAIIRHRLMDINVAITRTGVFVLVYTLILGLPFFVAGWSRNWLIEISGPNWWMWPLGLMAALATLGPFIYIYVERKAEEALLREQIRYQETLKQASVGMTRIRDLHRLLDLIAHIVTKTVRISYAAIYLQDSNNDKYILQVSRDKGRISLPEVSSNNVLINNIRKNREPLVFEEIKRQMEDTHSQEFIQLEEQMRLLTASVIIPSFFEDKLMGFIVLGDKVSGQIYTAEDLNVFQILASQAAMAIENAQFYEETKQMQEQVGQAEKMATIGTMADGLSHQINNRFYALSLIAGDTIDTIKLTDTSKCTPEIKEMIESINRALQRIQSNVIQGGEVVKGILKYTRKGEENLEDITLDSVLDQTLEMVQYKVRLSEIDIIRNYPKDKIMIRGNAVQLQEAFFNFIDNANDAITERKTTLKEEGYRGKVTISAVPRDGHIEIIVEDNGIGV
ncbi:MAG: histidine kinase N-terminal 7TM domain-containing protein, partial [Actinomycetota bacterium]|nr:histidine kinase N-terminal 7TM domain-containing protein [Actinomycetota bacterium]